MFRQARNVRFAALTIVSAIAGSTALSVATAPKAYALQSRAQTPFASPQPKIDGLVIWGQGVGPIPRHVAYFNGKSLRHVSLNPNVCAAVLQNGDVVAWTPSSRPDDDNVHLVLKGKDIHKVCISHGLIYAASSSKVYVCDAAKGSSSVVSFTGAKLGWFEKINDLVCGKDHMLVLTSNGRVFSGATGIERPVASKGQYGVASLSQFDKAPLPGKLVEIGVLKDTPISMIAAGDFHSLVLTKDDHRVMGFGDNTFSQLAIPYKYGTACVNVPTVLKTRGEPIQASYIAAGGSMSYYGTEPSKLNGGRGALYAMGNGLYGQLGTGSFANQQKDPVRVKYFDDLDEYSETHNSTRPINIQYLTVGTTHTGAVLDNEIPSSVFVWGGNDYSQLGNAKKSRASKPIPLSGLSDTPNLVAPTQVLLKNERFVCGDNLSAVYTCI